MSSTWVHFWNSANFGEIGVLWIIRRKRIEVRWRFDVSAQVDYTLGLNSNDSVNRFLSRTPKLWDIIFFFLLGFYEGKVTLWFSGFLRGLRVDFWWDCWGKIRFRYFFRAGKSEVKVINQFLSFVSEKWVLKSFINCDTFLWGDFDHLSNEVNSDMRSWGY